MGSTAPRPVPVKIPTAGVIPPVTRDCVCCVLLYNRATVCLPWGDWLLDRGFYQAPGVKWYLRRQRVSCVERVTYVVTSRCVSVAGLSFRVCTCYAWQAVCVVLVTRSSRVHKCFATLKLNQQLCRGWVWRFCALSMLEKWNTPFRCAVCLPVSWPTPNPPPPPTKLIFVQFVCYFGGSYSVISLTCVLQYANSSTTHN